MFGETTVQRVFLGSERHGDRRHQLLGNLFALLVERLDRGSKGGGLGRPLGTHLAAFRRAHVENFFPVANVLGQLAVVETLQAHRIFFSPPCPGSVFVFFKLQSVQFVRDNYIFVRF